MKKLFCIAAIMLIANYGINKFRLLQKITYKIVGIDISSRILESVVIVTIQFVNVTDVTATINSLITDIYFNSRYLGIATLAKPFTIPANGTVNVDVSIEVKSFDLLRSIIAALNTKVGKFRFQGKVSIDKINSLPFDFDYNLN